MTTKRINHILVGELVNGFKHCKNNDTDTLCKLTEKLCECNQYEVNDVIKYLECVTETNKPTIICKFDNFELFKYYIELLEKKIEKKEKLRETSIDWNLIMRYIVKYNKWQLFGYIILNYSKKYPQAFQYGVIFSALFGNKITCTDIKSFCTDIEYTDEIGDILFDSNVTVRVNEEDFGIDSGRWYEYLEIMFDSEHSDMKTFFRLLMLDIFCRGGLDVVIDDHSMWLRQNEDEVINQYRYAVFQSCFERNIYDCSMEHYDNIFLYYGDLREECECYKLCDIFNKFQNTQNKKINALTHHVKLARYYQLANIDSIFVNITKLLSGMLVTDEIIRLLKYTKYNEFISKHKGTGTTSIENNIKYLFDVYEKIIEKEE